MCQLLGMNCVTPTDFSFSFRGFARRGGDTDKHEHGWGIALYENRGLRTFLDTLPAAKSPVAELVERYPMKTLNMMAHIRYATQGAVELENVHPFQREMWGIQWCFCHNGEVPKYTGGGHRPYREMPALGRTRPCSRTYHPVGDTDSEAVFCAILDALRAEFDTLPSLPVLFETLQRFCCEIVRGCEESTIFNFLLGCGQYTLFAYSWPGARPGSDVWNGLHYTIRSPPFSKATLSDTDYAVNFADVTTPSDRVAVIATVPLTVDEKWTEFRRGQLLMFDCGHPYRELYDCDEVERSGRGLCSRALRRDAESEVERRRSVAYDAPSLLRALVDEVVGSRAGSHSDSNSGSSGCDREGNECWARRGFDLGCGSGLSGAAFRSCVSHLTGVDLSREMLDKARKRGCHDELVVGDIDTALRGRWRNRQQKRSLDVRENDDGGGCGVGEVVYVSAPCGGCEGEGDRSGTTEDKAEEADADDDDALEEANVYDLVVACSVFVYVGDLRGVFRSVRDILSPKRGLFVFSAEFLEEKHDNDNDNNRDYENGNWMSRKEKNDNDSNGGYDNCDRRPFVLQTCARYAHERSYVEGLARECGFEIRAIRTSPIRTYKGQGVSGALVVMSLPQ